MTAVDSALHDAASFLLFLVREGVLTEEAAQRARQGLSLVGQHFDVVVTELGLMGADELARQLSVFLNLPQEELPTTLPALEGVSMAFLRDNVVLPLRCSDESLVIATADPFSRAALGALVFHLDCRQLELRILPRRAILECIERLSGEIPNDRADDHPAEQAVGQDDLERLKDFAREAPVVRYVADMIHRAVDANATDIHIEPAQDHVRIRFRRDGMLGVVDKIPKSLLAGVATRIKILSRLNIAERRLPQDGRMRIAVRGRDIELRVSTVPSVHGETIVLRILDRAGVQLRLERLGFDDEAQSRIRRLSNMANGIVLVTGPTGSGKTTTLYSVLNEIVRTDVKIFTVEDPVEYQLDGVIQLQVNPAISLDFAAALRSVLRQDPDIILIGEIRDRETAQIAIQAALTGHLVFSTLHTNSAAGALTRLLDMGIDSFLLGSTIRGVVAQRLLRRTCADCRERDGGTDGKQCSRCGGAGYSGRTVTYEILELTRRIGDLVHRSASEAEIETVAAAEGMVPMAAHALSLVEHQVTDLSEVRRVLDFGGTGQ